MFKMEFKKIVDDWISYYGKKFTANDHSTDVQVYKRHLEILYKATSHMTAKELTRGFEECVKIHDYYPKVSQLLKFCPTERKVDNTPDYRPIPISPASKEKIKNAIAGSSRTQLGEEVIRNNFALVAKRFPNTNWDDAIKRELARDAKRIERK